MVPIGCGDALVEPVPFELDEPEEFIPDEFIPDDGMLEEFIPLPVDVVPVDVAPVPVPEEPVAELPCDEVPAEDPLIDPPLEVPPDEADPPAAPPPAWATIAVGEPAAKDGAADKARRLVNAKVPISCARKGFVVILMAVLYPERVDMNVGV